MAKVYVSAVIDAPLDSVWAIIRRFDALPEWLPGITGCKMEDERVEDAVGAIRAIETGQSDAVVREKLCAMSDLEHSMSYSVVEGPLPIRNLVATIRLHPITDREQTFGEWSAEFEPEPGAEEKAPRILTKVFAGGWQGLKSHLESSIEE